MLFRALCTVYYVYTHLKHAHLFSWWLKPAPNLHHSHSLEPQIFHLELQVSSSCKLVASVQHRQSCDDGPRRGWTSSASCHDTWQSLGFLKFLMFWCIWISCVSCGIEVSIPSHFSVAPMYFCAGYIEDPWGRKYRNKGRARKQWWADNAYRQHGGYYAPPPQPVAPSAPAAPASRAPPVVVPARVKVPVVVVSDEGDSGVPVVSGVSDKKPPIPKRNAKPKPKAMPTCLQEGSAPAKPAGLKVKAKPKPPAGPAPGVSGVAGVAGAKRKNSRSPSAGGKRKIARSAASSSSAAGGSSGAQIPLRQPLLGQSFRIYSAGMRQASDRDFMSPSWNLIQLSIF